MNIDTRTIVSMTEANQNFSKVAKLVDRYGNVVVFKNNAPKYLIIEFDEVDKLQFSSDDTVQLISNQIISRNKLVYKELAK